MKSLRLLAATLSVSALAAVAALPALAQDNTTPSTTTQAGSTMSTQTMGTGTTSSMQQQGSGSMQGDMKKPQEMTNPSTGKTVVVVPEGAGARDQYRAMWAFRNLDDVAVRRYKAKGFPDETIKGAANIALRTGLDVDYVLRLVQEAGYPLARVAAMYNVSTLQLGENIPGYGAEGISIVTPQQMASINSPAPVGRYSSASMSSTGSMSSSNPSVSSSTTTSSTTTATTTTGNASSAAQPGMGGTVVDVALMDPDFSTLSGAITSAELGDTLKGAGPYTILAPTNAAFAKLPAGTLDALMKPENRETLRAILLYHVVPGRVMAADVMGMTNPSTPRTLNGATLNVKTTAPVMVNDANVTKTDIAGSNGVIHVIDTVLLPPGLDLSTLTAGSSTAAPATTPSTTP